jgi:hypothetical protein
METQHNIKYLALLGSLVVGMITGVVFDPYLPAPLSNTERGYQNGFSAAKSLVENSAIGSTLLRTPEDIRTLSGMVTVVNGNTITLHTISNDPFADAALSDRMVTIDASTKIVALTQKDPKTLQGEMAAFAKASPASATPPAPFTQTPADRSSITVGTTLSVTAPENIRSTKEFTASEIMISTQVTPSQLPPAL